MSRCHRDLRFHARFLGPLRVRGRRNIAFITSAMFETAQLAGAGAADALCASAAADAGFPGPFVAWLSSVDTDAAEKVPDLRGWVRTDGAEVLADTAALRAGDILRRLQTDAGVNARAFTTATNVGGAFSGFDCAGFSDPAAQATFGDGAAAGGRFHATRQSACDEDHRLLCIGIDPTLSGPLVQPERSARTMFVSEARLAADGGRDPFDAACAAEAAAAGFAGNFVAMIATDGGSAAERFSDGLPWARADGVLIAETVADVLAGDVDAAPDMNADGTIDDDFYWAGTQLGPGSTGSDATTCADWTSGDNMLLGAAGITRSTGHFFRNAGTSCNSMRPVICAEQ